MTSNKFYKLSANYSHNTSMLNFKIILFPYFTARNSCFVYSFVIGFSNKVIKGSPLRSKKLKKSETLLNNLFGGEGGGVIIVDKFILLFGANKMDFKLPIIWYLY